jgi:hypothetical protein
MDLNKFVTDRPEEVDLFGRTSTPSSCPRNLELNPLNHHRLLSTVCLAFS